MASTNSVIGKNRPLYRAQRYLCYLCGHRVFDHHWLPRQQEPSIDHVRPKVHGYGRPGNKLIAHRRCNMEKGSRKPRPCELLFLAVTNEIVAWYAAPTRVLIHERPG